MSQSVYCAMKAVIKNNNLFLALKQRVGEVDIWDLPGGKVEHGESPYDTLRREVQEETGLTISIDKPLGVWWFFRNKDGAQIVCTTFLCTSQDTNINLENNPTQEKITEYRWVTKDELLSLTYGENTHNLIETLKLI
jgi:8-oxo-dGTP diphosphatase